jgi:hypothetical protein
MLKEKKTHLNGGNTIVAYIQTFEALLKSICVYRQLQSLQKDYLSARRKQA